MAKVLDIHDERLWIMYTNSRGETFAPIDGMTMVRLTLPETIAWHGWQDHEPEHPQVEAMRAWCLDEARAGLVYVEEQRTCVEDALKKKVATFQVEVALFFTDEVTAFEFKMRWG